jgi:hypothetical protein
MVEQSPVIENLGKALSIAQSQMEGAKKDSINPHFRSKYADLESVWQGCRDALANNGLSVVQMPAFEDGMCVLYTQLIHSSGEWIRSRSAAPIVKQDAQAVGSAITYLRRYALAAVVGVCPEDDDGNGCSDTPRQPEKRKPEARVEWTPSHPRGEDPAPAKKQPTKPDPALSILEKPKPKNRWECHPRLLAACKERAAEIGNGDRERTTKAGSRIGDAIEKLYGPLTEIAEGDALEGAIEMAFDFER